MYAGQERVVEMFVQYLEKTTQCVSSFGYAYKMLCYLLLENFRFKASLIVLKNDDIWTQSGDTIDATVRLIMSLSYLKE